MTDAPGPDPAVPPAKLLRCHACGRTVACTDGEFFAFVRNGWPKCCGETMAVFVEAFRPGPIAASGSTTPGPPGHG